MALAKPRNGTDEAAMSELPPTVHHIVLALDDSGVIHGCERAGELLNYGCSELIGQHVSLVLPELKDSELMRDGRPSPRLRFLARIGHRFHVVTRDGRHFLSDLFLNCIGNADAASLRLIVRPLALV
jgi:hypothetical protein